MFQSSRSVLMEFCGADPGWAAAWTGRHLPQMSGVTFCEADRLRSSRAALAHAGHRQR